MAAPVGHLAYVVVDSTDPERLAAFWGAMLGVEVRARWNQYVMLASTAPGGPGLNIQGVPDARPPGKNRLHLDLHVRDLDAASARALVLGATTVGDVAQDELRWRVMADPEGNEFCLVLDPQAPGR